LEVIEVDGWKNVLFEKEGISFSALVFFVAEFVPEESDHEFCIPPWLPFSWMVSSSFLLLNRSISTIL
jgi:hypothetical protein